jgi:transcriptional regulator with XRE-family HTH domain
LGVEHGERLRTRRKALGWTQEEFARRVGVTHTTVIRAERYGGGLASTWERMLRVLRDAEAVTEKEDRGDGTRAAAEPPEVA